MIGKPIKQKSVINFESIKKDMFGILHFYFKPLKVIVNNYLLSKIVGVIYPLTAISEITWGLMRKIKKNENIYKG